MQIVSLDAELSLDKLFIAVEVSQKNPLLKTHRSRRKCTPCNGGAPLLSVTPHGILTSSPSGQNT